MKRLIFSALVLSAVTANAQVKDGMVGINTDEPRATMHIEPGVSESKGLIIPRITAAQMKTMTNLAHFGADHHAIITYLKEQLPTADRTGKLVDVAAPGYYYYDNTTGVQKWKTFGGGEQDLRYINTNHITKDAGVGSNGTSVGWGVHNIGLGASVLSSNTLGHQNIAIGAGSLGLNTTGGQNVALGVGTLGLNTTGSSNIAIGSDALQGQSSTIPMTGDFNIALGTNALKNNTTGNNNIAQGYQALYYNTTGVNNIALGEGALQGQFGTPITGNNNIALGQNALKVNTTGGLNIALGQDALYSNTTGGWNIAQGLHALYKNTSGEQNIALGRNALYQNTSGKQNIGIGDGALPDNLTGQFNTAVGGYSGAWIKGNGNVHIGSGGGVPSTELDNVVLIGSLTNTLDATTGEDNVILLGDNTSFAPRVGVGTYKPQAKLDVAGAVRVANDTSACTSANEGAIRYNKPTKKFQGCDGTGWVNLN